MKDPAILNFMVVMLSNSYVLPTFLLVTPYLTNSRLTLTLVVSDFPPSSLESNKVTDRSRPVDPENSTPIRLRRKNGGKMSFSFFIRDT